MITVGVSYFFSHYARKEIMDNSITSESVTFLYTEVEKVGNVYLWKNADKSYEHIPKDGALANTAETGRKTGGGAGTITYIKIELSSTTKK